MTQKTFTYLSWLGVVTMLGLVIYVWGDHASWRIGSLNTYQWFPLFGLLAWTIMALHYYLGSLRVLIPGLRKPNYFKAVTGWLVLGSILLHPGLLAYEQSKNGEGLPPDSFVSYVGEGFKLAAMLGTISLIIFLSFEVFDRIRRGNILKKFWWVISMSQSIAMVLIWIHGFRLGTHINGWFEIVWIVMGALLIPTFFVIHRSDFTSR